MWSLKKAYEIKDAKIQFVSLVDKAANKRKFLIKKEAGGRATFTTYGRIVKADAENHYVTGIVYEPMTEDSHGNFMTEAEITKAAYYFAKNGSKVDLQHSFEPMDGATVVESWIAKADFDIGGETIKKGTWLMTVEVADESVWEGIEKGEITGFSMGGLGNYSEEDVELDKVSKQEATTERKGLLQKLANSLGFELIEKGAMADQYAMRSKCSQFWDCLNTFEAIVHHYNPMTDRYEFEKDESKVREALEEFNAIMTEILTSGQNLAEPLAKSMPVEKAGRKMSGKNFEALKGIYESLGTFINAFEDKADEAPPADEQEDEQQQDPENQPDEKEDEEVKKSEVETIVENAVSAAVSKALGDEAAKKEDDKLEKAEEVTPELIEQLVEKAVAKAMEPKEDPISLEQVQEMITKAVNSAVEPVLKSKGLPTAMETVEKGEEKQHYLHGIL